MKSSFFAKKLEDIATFTQAIIANTSTMTPVYSYAMSGEVPVATQIFVHATDRQNIFSIIGRYLDKLHLNIQDARLHTTHDNRAFDVFYVSGRSRPPIGTSLSCVTVY